MLPAFVLTEHAYALAKGDYERWGGLKALHSRQVQLALAKRRAGLARRF